MSNNNSLEDLTTEQLSKLYVNKISQALDATGWRRDQLEQDADKVFDILREKGYFINYGDECV